MRDAPAEGGGIEDRAEDATRRRCTRRHENRAENGRRKGQKADPNQDMRLGKALGVPIKDLGQKVQAEQYPDHQPDDRLLVLGVRPRGEARACRCEEVAQRLHQAPARSSVGSWRSRCTSRTRSLMPRNASTRRGSKCLPRCARMYSSASADFQAFL